MLSKELQDYFFELYKNAFYHDDKITIEELYKKIEKPEVREIRDNLLLEAEKRAEKLARKAVNKIKNKSFSELSAEFLGDEENNSGEEFGKDLLEEIEKELKKN
ncbi:MAG: hypothetical protein K5790_01800 [Nitrosopumilus sp.]|uniref:hypothetical protein n=1 Tax=Nitrosopumilus sp. TaxID=2024843 RepID=UPI00247C8269|nr:hypothetical protein [Nitrosopumilus sp.]MCV0392008.1 hypothetical protein [Nitrosopumilus sp.]